MPPTHPPQDAPPGAARPVDPLSASRVGLPAPGRPVDRWSERIPGPEERARLVATLGATLRRMRQERGLSTRALAVRAAVARTTVTRLESGRRRPRPVTLSALAYALDPTHRQRLLDALLEAAGESLRPDTETGIRAHRRRANRATAAGLRPLPPDVARRVELHHQADNDRATADRILSQPGARHDAQSREVAAALIDRARRTREAAGPPVSIRLGKHHITAGRTN